MARNYQPITGMLLAFAVSVPLFGGLTATPAYAADASCATPIIDEMNVLGDNLPVVEDAVAKLEATGADVRVRTYDSYAPFGSLDEKLREERIACDGNWSFDNGETMKGNLIVYGLTTDPENAQMFFYGSDWEDTLGGTRSEELQANVMAPYLGDGEFAEGIAAGLTTVADDINEGRSSSGDTIVNEAADLSGLWSIISIILLVIGVIIGLGALFFGIRRSRSYLTELKTAKAASSEAQQDANRLYLDLNREGNDGFRQLALDDIRGVSSIYAHEADTHETTYATNSREATWLLREANESFSNPTFTERNSVSWHEKKQAVYRRIHQHAANAQSAAESIATMHEKVIAEVDRISEMIDISDNDLKLLSDDVQELKEAGYMTDSLESMISEACRDSEVVRALPRKISTLDEVHALSSSVGAIIATKREYEAQIARCKQDESRLLESLAATPAAIKSAENALSRMEATFNPDNWKDVAGNIERAAVCFWTAEGYLRDGAGKADMQTQQWDAAIYLFIDGAAEVSAGLTLLNDVEKREQTLNTLQANAASEVDATQRSIQRTLDFCEAHAADIKQSVSGSINKATKSLDAARQELSKAQPNYVELTNHLQYATDENSSAYRDASRQHELAAAARREARQAYNSAETAVEKAQTYISRNRSDSGFTARNSLETAQSQLNQAEQADDPQVITRYAKQAKSSAEEALRKAKSSVSSAQLSRNSTSSGFAAGAGLGIGIGSGGGFGGGGGSSSGFGGGSGGGGGSSSGF